MGGIDEDAEWLALLVLALALPFLIAAVLTVVDLWTRGRRFVAGDRRRVDVAVVGATAVAAIVVGAIRGGWAAAFAVVVVVLAARLADVAFDRRRPGPGRGITAARRALLLGLVVGIVGVLG